MYWAISVSCVAGTFITIYYRMETLKSASNRQEGYRGDEFSTRSIQFFVESSRSMLSRNPSVVLLYHLRWLAAAAVAVSHIRQNFIAGNAQEAHHGILATVVFLVSDFGGAAVMIFFVLSGFLVGGKALDLFQSSSVAQEWPHFLIDRFSRTFVVLWPALALAGGAALLLHIIAPDAPFMTNPHWGPALYRPINGDISVQSWLGAAALVNGLASPMLQINGPLWSLAFEWFYYIAALALILGIRGVFSAGAVAIMVYAVILFGLGLIFNSDMIVWTLVWIMGMASRFAFDRGVLRGTWLRIGSLVLLLTVLVEHHIHDVSNLLIGLATAVVIANRDWASWKMGAAWGEKLAGFSYSFYLTHFPITVAILGILYRCGITAQRLPLNGVSLAIMLLTLAFAVVTARMFALVTEDRTRDVRDLLLRRLKLNTRRPGDVIRPAR
jgi:peptidoglycan/LPS O-acetylase OafA/YrhL